ncbi:MAG TPA: EamA family transporter, partial [Terriglobales bacterium]|nr:EamA family transporter [Terriglobales bacterium]
AHPARGYFYIASATFLWGVAATLGRAAFTGRLLPRGEALRPIDPLILSQSRVTFSFLVLLPVLWLSRGAGRLRLPAGDTWRLFLLGIFGVAASNYFYYLAIQRTSVAVAIILQYTAPVWVLLYMVMRGLERATAQRVVAVALALAGIVLVIGMVGSGGVRLDTLGVAAAMLAALAFACYNVGGHSLLARYDRWTVLLFVTSSASLFWLVVNPPWKIAAAHYSAVEWTFLLIFSLLSVLGPFSLYFAGLQHLEPTRAIVVSCLEPVFSIVIAAAVLGEVIRPVQMMGIVLVLAATLVVQLPDRKGRATVVEPIE